MNAKGNFLPWPRELAEAEAGAPVAWKISCRASFRELQDMRGSPDRSERDLNTHFTLFQALNPID